MNKERRFKYTYLFLSDLLYMGVIATPIIATIFSILFFGYKQFILANTLLILVVVTVIYLLFELGNIKKRINYNVANYVINEYLINNKYYFLNKVEIELPKSKEFIDYVIVTSNGLILMDVYESYASSSENSAKFDKETKIILQIQKMIEELNKDKSKENPIDFENLPIKYIVACANNLLYMNKENKEENKQIVRKNAYEVSNVMNKFIEQNKAINLNMDNISSIYYMFKKLTLDYKKEKKL